MSSSPGTSGVLEQARSRLLQGDAEGARELIDSIGGAPDGPTLHLAGLTAAALNDFPGAVAFLRRGLRLEPGNRPWTRDLAIALTGASCYAEAESLFAELASQDPGNPELAALHARVLLRCGRASDAAEACRRSLSRRPGHSRTQLTLARALFAADSFAGAAMAAEECLASEPENARAWDLLGNIRSVQARHHAVMECRETVCRLQPENSEALAWVAWARFQAGETGQALADSRSLIAAGTATPEVWSAWLQMLLHDCNQDARTLRQEHERRPAAEASPEAAAVSPLPAHGGGKVRVGYVWGESAASPFRHFLSPLLRHHDRSAFDISWYDTRADADSRGSPFRHPGDRRFEAGHLSSADLARQIRADGTDILIDLTGHYFPQRLDLFAHRAAPVQASFPNYPATTGARGVDYIFTDRWVCPPGLEHQYSEEPRFLPGGYLAWEPPADLPVRRGRGERLTFGLFQRPAKYNAPFWDTVAAILAQCTGAVLLVHYFSAELDEPDSRPCRRICLEMEARGIAASRVRLRGARSMTEHLALLAEADIALDTFPYNGQTTTCECLWMGVPVVTLAGGWHAARVGYALVDRAGLGHLAAEGTSGYVRTAVRLAADPDALSAGRQELRARLQASSVMDGAALAGNLEHELRVLLNIHRR